MEFRRKKRRKGGKRVDDRNWKRSRVRGEEEGWKGRRKEELKKGREEKEGNTDWNLGVIEGGKEEKG